MNEILVLSHPGEAEVALVADGVLTEFRLWRRGAGDGVGDRHRGRVLAAVPAMAGYFVALADAEGFLPETECGRPLRAGEAVTVAITRAAQGGKGPRLSARGLPEAAPGPPALLQPGPTPVASLAAEYPEAPVLVDDAALAAELRPELDKMGLGDRLRLLGRHDQAEGLCDQIAALGETDLTLPEGPRLSFHPTPALVAIDIDLGRLTGERGSRNAAQKAANRALLPVLARQIRLRNLSGAILVDLAGMPVRARAALAPDLAAALAADPLRPKLLGFTGLGLAEIVRPRLHPPLHEQRAGALAAGLAALRAAGADQAVTQLAAAPSVIAALQADGFARLTFALADFTRLTGRALALVSEPMLAPLGWRLR